jgi:cell division GTPase FtsZ
MAKEKIIVDDIDLDNSTVEAPVQDDAGDKLAALRARLQEMDKPKSKPKQVRKTRSLNIGVVGSGQAGSRIAEVFYDLGYPAIVVNTAQQDLEYIKLPVNNKLLLEYGIGGSAKTLSIGRDAIDAHRQEVSELIEDKLGECQAFALTFSLGGGSGSGSAKILIDLLSTFGKPIVVIAVLPMLSEDAQAKANSLETLSQLTKEIQSKKIHNLILVDNARLETIYTDVSQMDFYDVGNRAIVEPFDVFNVFSSIPSPHKSLDSMEFAKILTDGDGLSTYGCLVVSNYEQDTAIAEAIVDNLNSNLLAGGFDLKQAKYVGVIMVASEKVWKNIPATNINYAMTMVNESAGTPVGIYKGIYPSDEIHDDVVKIYSFFSGLSLPDARIDELKKEAAEQKKLMKEKEKTRNVNLSINTGSTDVMTSAEQINQKIQARKSAFGSFTSGSVVDKRKK